MMTSMLKNHLRIKIAQFLTSAFNSQMITETELQFITCKYPVRPVLYVLPKVRHFKIPQDIGTSVA